MVRRRIDHFVTYLQFPFQGPAFQATVPLPRLVTILAEMFFLVWIRLRLWTRPLTSFFEIDLDNIKTNLHAKYIGQRSFRSKVIFRTDRQTHTQPTDCSTWFVMMVFDDILADIMYAYYFFQVSTLQSAHLWVFCPVRRHALSRAIKARSLFHLHANGCSSRTSDDHGDQKFQRQLVPAVTRMLAINVSIPNLTVSSLLQFRLWQLHLWRLT